MTPKTGIYNVYICRGPFTSLGTFRSSVIFIREDLVQKLLYDTHSRAHRATLGALVHRFTLVGDISLLNYRINK